MAPRRKIILLAGAVAVLAALGWAALGRKPQTRPNVIIIVVDTMRRDHVGAYGYARSATPTIDALASENVLFANAWANANWTKPSVASLLTGLYVSQHGVKYVVTSTEGQPPTTQRLPDDVTTLPEMLQAAGYNTLGVVENVHISRKLGFAQGFDVWDESPYGATNVSNSFMYHFKDMKPPFFAYVHYFDPHAPYYRTRIFESGGAIEPGLRDVKSTDFAWSTYTYGVDRGIVGLSPIERDRLVELYDGEVRYADLGIARILATLKERGLYDNTLVIVTADHGENFYEGRRLAHPHDSFSNAQDSACRSS